MDKNKFQNQDFLSNFSRASTSQHQHSKDNPSLCRPKSPTKTSNKKCFKCLGFGHRAANYPEKRIMLVKRGIVVSEHSDQSSRSNSPTPSKDEC